MVIKICDWLTVNEAKREYVDLWDTYKDTFPYASNSDIANMISIFLEVCHYCKSDTIPCHCMNDE